jgi:hypothetical protein
MKRVAIITAAMFLSACTTLHPGSAGYTVYEAALGANVTKAMPCHATATAALPAQTIRCASLCAASTQTAARL